MWAWTVSLLKKEIQEKETQLAATFGWEFRGFFKVLYFSRRGCSMYKSVLFGVFCFVFFLGFFVFVYLFSLSLCNCMVYYVNT